MLSVHEIESLRRSHAMSPLAPGHVTALLETCAELAQKHAEVVRLLADLPNSFGAVRTTLNQLARIVEVRDDLRTATLSE